MKRRICLLLALLMVLTAAFGLSSCKKDGEGEETTVSTTGGGAAGAPGTKDDPTLYEDLPTGDYGGYEFKFLNNESGYANTTIVPTVTTDNLNQAMYNRNAFVKETLKINIKEVTLGYQEAYDEMYQLASTGTFEYDASYNEVVFQTPLAQSGAYYSVEEYEEYLNFDKPWWFTDAMDSIRIDGRGFELFGDLQLMYYDSIWGMAFNQQILGDNHQEYPYDLVRSGDWTIDELKDIIAATATPETENWGMLSHKDFISAMICASDFVLVSQDEDEVLVKFDNTEIFSQVYEKIREAFFTSNGEEEKVNYIIADYKSEAYNADFTHAAAKEKDWEFQKMFTEGKGSFMAGTIGDIQMVRAAEFQYGIVPFPKYSAEDQSQYVNWIYRGAASCGIPAASNPDDLQRTCTVLENLAAYSYKLVKSEYYEVVVQTRTVRDNDSIEMLDIIFGHNELGTTRFEIDTVFEIGISDAIRKEMSDNSTAIMSELGNFSEINAKIAEVIEDYKG